MDALLQQSYTDYVVYLVDNGSEQDNVVELRNRFDKHPKINLVFNQKNLGFTKGNNEILRQILKQDFKYVVLLNNDTTQEPDWLENLVASAERHQVDMVCSKMIDYNRPKRMDNAGHRMLNTAEIIAISHGESIEDYTESFENFGPCAGAALYSTEMLRTIGIFDEYFNTGYEDAELGVRANILGYTSIFEPSAVVYHKISTSINKVRTEEYNLKMRLAVHYTYLKLMPLPVILFNIPSLLFKYISILIIDIILLRISFLKMLFKSFFYTFSKEWDTIYISRTRFFQNHELISSWKIIKMQTFFLWFDMKNFWNYVVLKKKPYQ